MDSQLYSQTQLTKLAVGLEEAEEVTGISQHLLRKMVQAGRVKAARVGRRILIPVSELQCLVKAGAVTSTEAAYLTAAERAKGLQRHQKSTSIEKPKRRTA